MSEKILENGGKVCGRERDDKKEGDRVFDRNE